MRVTPRCPLNLEELIDSELGEVTHDKKRGLLGPFSKKRGLLGRGLRKGACWADKKRGLLGRGVESGMLERPFSSGM